MGDDAVALTAASETELEMADTRLENPCDQSMTDNANTIDNTQNIAPTNDHSMYVERGLSHISESQLNRIDAAVNEYLTHPPSGHAAETSMINE
jgi:hypothetical protein